MIPPLNLQKWIEENRDLLKPPVGNKQVYADQDLEVFIVGGPNSRTDFHTNPRNEFFYQIEGTMNLRVIENGEFKDIPIGPGELFMLPPNVPHAPMRGPQTVGMVIEVNRTPEEEDLLQWFCDKCQNLLYQEKKHIGEIAENLPPIFKRYWGNPENTTCKECGHKHVRPGAQ